MKLLVIQPEAPGQKPLEWWSEISQIGEITGVDMKLIAAKQATIARISAALRNPYDVVIWSGHGGIGKLAVVDGFVSADWLACQLKQAPPALLVLAACLSGQRDAALNSIAEIISQAGINCVGMWVSVEDKAAITYNVELVRALSAGTDVSRAHRVAVAQMAMACPNMADAAFLLPGLANGYGKVLSRIVALEEGFQCVRGDVCSVKERMGGMETMLRMLVDGLTDGGRRDANHRAGD
jgi:hypothetical protein